MNSFQTNMDNLPEINDDRIFYQNMQGPGFILIFKLCGHHIHIKTVVIMNMNNTLETIEYINGLKCPECESEFREMELKLGREYRSLIEKGKWEL